MSRRLRRPRHDVRRVHPATPSPSAPPRDKVSGRKLDFVDPSLAPGLAITSFAARRADAVELHAMAADDEAEEAPDPLLQPLELLARELDDLAAALAEDVIVVLC